MSDKPTLYHHGSSACAAKVRFVLEEKQIAWDGIYVDILAGEQFSDDFLAVNPKGVVPVLVHDGVVIRESSVICEYAEEAFPGTPKLMPQTPAARAAVRIWTKAVDEELHPACSALTYVVSHRHTILARGVGDFESFLSANTGEGRSTRERKWRWIHEGLAAPGAADQVRLYVAYLGKMEQALAGNEWLVGDSFTLADAAMAPYLNRLSALAMDPLWQGGTLPNVARWFDAVRARPSFAPAFQRWMPESLASEMHANGQKSWPEIERMLAA